MTEKTALVLGATGGVGGEIASALARHGWRVRGMARDPAAAANRLPQFAWAPGDALNRDDVTAAARGADVIVHAVNPPAYRNWAGTVLPMIRNTIAAAQAANARIVLPGTLYNFGPETFPLIAEDAPQNPRTRKGQIRVALERELERAATRGVRSLIVRAGDFFGPRLTANAWFSQMVTPGKPVRSITYPGRPNVGHAWAYLPDLAETVAQLLERRDDLAAFERFHFAGHSFGRGIEFAEGVRDIVGGRAAIRPLPWPLLRVMALFNETVRETLEMRYLWTEDVRLDNRKLVGFLGAEPHTPLREALRRTLEGQGNRPGPQAARSDERAARPITASKSAQRS